jgi:hypothetical protein
MLYSRDPRWGSRCGRWVSALILILCCLTCHCGSQQRWVRNLRNPLLGLRFWEAQAEQAAFARR